MISKKNSLKILIVLKVILNAFYAAILMMVIVFLVVWRYLKNNIIKTFIYFVD
tara:strand:- start:572 stop:730 length:159 start_codon:yes stop_codon:yes gene_type:complete